VRLAEQGRDHVALMHWVLHPGPLDEEQIAVLRRTADRAPIPVLEPYIALHEAMTSGDPEQVRHALSSPGLKVVPGIVQAAIRMVGDVPRPVAHAGRGMSGRSRPEVDVELLTRRERQIAALAREGAPNKDIADALLLSRRTVENHMSHVLSKLGLTSRAQLQEIARF
jgi:DNA-binding CsgD family transcriptional regulator